MAGHSLLRESANVVRPVLARADALRGSLVNILSLFWRKPPQNRRAMTPVEARARQAAAANMQADAAQPVHGGSPNPTTVAR
ncbi:MAG: hypothetical protein WCF66_17375, partial [Pseudolabrys sp.]